MNSSRLKAVDFALRLWRGYFFSRPIAVVVGCIYGTQFRMIDVYTFLATLHRIALQLGTLISR